MSSFHNILRYALRVILGLSVAITFTMCAVSEPVEPMPDVPVNPGNPKDIPIKRPPKGDELKKIRPRLGWFIDPVIVKPSDSFLGSIFMMAKEYADVEICNLATGEIYAESFKGGERSVEYLFEPDVKYRVRLCVDGKHYEEEL